MNVVVVAGLASCVAARRVLSTVEQTFDGAARMLTESPGMYGAYGPYGGMGQDTGDDDDTMMTPGPMGGMTQPSPVPVVVPEMPTPTPIVPAPVVPTPSPEEMMMMPPGGADVQAEMEAPAPEEEEMEAPAEVPAGGAEVQAEMEAPAPEEEEMEAPAEVPAGGAEVQAEMEAPAPEEEEMEAPAEVPTGGAEVQATAPEGFSNTNTNLEGVAPAPANSDAPFGQGSDIPGCSVDHVDQGAPGCEQCQEGFFKVNDAEENVKDEVCMPCSAIDDCMLCNDYKGCGMCAPGCVETPGTMQHYNGKFYEVDLCDCTAA